MTFASKLDVASRREILEAAASELELSDRHVGDGPAGGESAEAALARMLSQELASLPPMPDVDEITATDFEASQRDLPDVFRRRSVQYRYFWMRIPLELRSKLGWAFTRLECAVEFNPGESEPRLRPTAYAILPDRRFDHLLDAQTHLEVSLDANFELSAGVPKIPIPAPIPITAGAGATARLGGGTGVSGSFEWRLQRARIDHTETGHARVFWRIDGTDFFGEQVPTPIVLIQVDRSIERLQVIAAMEVYRHLSLLNASLQQKIQGLPRRLREFFTDGSPLPAAPANWDLSHLLSR